MIEMNPYLLVAMILAVAGYYGALELWAQMVAFWHVLPALGHGLLHVMTLGVK